MIHDLIAKTGGSISSEHGLGQYRLAERQRLTPATGRDLAVTIKRAMDLKGLMNPGKAIPET